MSNENEPKDKQDENAPEPFIHISDNYSSAYFGDVPEHVVEGVPQKFDKKLTSTLISQLTDPNLRETRHEVLNVLKNGQSQELLVEIAAMKEYKKHRAVILAACWECGLDFSKYLTSFVDFALAGDERECLEAMTVITENMPGPFDEKELADAKTKIASAIGLEDARRPFFELIRERLESL